jgi:hypothetical protein
MEIQGIEDWGGILQKDHPAVECEGCSRRPSFPHLTCAHYTQPERKRRAGELEAEFMPDPRLAAMRSLGAEWKRAGCREVAERMGRLAGGVSCGGMTGCERLLHTSSRRV